MSIKLGLGQQITEIQLDKLNRHGIIAGATGTGKTVTLKVIAEQLSSAGIPVFLSDVKGDLASIAEESDANEAIQQRVTSLNYQTFEPQSFPVELWDVYGEQGIPLRITVSEMGPLMLTRLLGLNETQSGILNIVFDVADERQLLLLDLMDLRAMLNYVKEHAKELSHHYGNIAPQSVGAILRSLVTLEQQGGDIFFNEPSLDIHDLIRTDTNGKGIVNILKSDKLLNQPILYGTVLLAILSELYDVLPEVGDLPQPKIVFFFDEAHTLFKDTPKILLDKIELIVRLVRSKGVGVFFVTQNPVDIPDSIAAQLGNRVQHGLRAFTPKEVKNLKAVSETFRQDESSDLADVIQHLQIGEAVVSTLQDDGAPSVADIVRIYPPQSKLGTIDPNRMQRLINNSAFYTKYSEAVNRESAHEQIEKEIQALQQAAAEEAIQSSRDVVSDKSSTNRSSANRGRTGTTRRSDSPIDRFTKNVMSAVGREVGRMLTRGITGMLKGK